MIRRWVTAGNPQKKDTGNPGDPHLFFGNYSIKTTLNQYYYGKNSKNLIYFSI
jgi:hypothetical protein